VIECRTYTHARRHPLVIGRIGGYALPTPMMPTQVVVLVGSAAVAVWTRRWWAVLPGAADLAVAAALPVLLAWAVRHARVEGRPPLRAAIGWCTYAARPRRGRRGGRPVPAERPVRAALRPAGRGRREVLR
jgi:hypothetical protein